MNPRERLMLVVLIAVVGVGGFAIGTHFWFIKPLLTYNGTIRTLREERDLEQVKWDTFVDERKKLELAKLKSLPVRPNEAQAVYSYFLEKAVERSGLNVTSIVPSAAVKVKPAAAIPNVKDVGHQVMTFTISARGDLGEVVKLMEILQTTPFEHRVRSLNMDRADQGVAKTASKKLVINMVIETLLVAGNQNRPGHPPGVNTQCLIYDHIAGRSGMAPMGWGLIGNMLSLRLASPLPKDRRYARIADKNIFVGAIPIEKYPKTTPSPKTFVAGPKSPGNVPAYIKLIQTVPTQQEAYMINLFYRNEELKLSSHAKTGYQVRRISDDYGNYVFCFMKVLRVDSGLVFFQVKDEIYSIELGQSLADALEEPLTEAEIVEYRLTPDMTWAKEQMKGEKAKGRGR